MPFTERIRRTQNLCLLLSCLSSCSLLPAWWFSDSFVRYFLVTMSFFFSVGAPAAIFAFSLLLAPIISYAHLSISLRVCRQTTSHQITANVKRALPLLIEMGEAVCQWIGSEEFTTVWQAGRQLYSSICIRGVGGCDHQGGVGVCSCSPLGVQTTK